LVFSRVIVREGQGRPAADEKASAGLLTPAEYSMRGIHGLRSKTTIRAYWRAWSNAIADGLAQPVSQGDEVELPIVPWVDYYHPADQKEAGVSERETASKTGRSKTTQHYWREWFRDQFGSAAIEPEPVGAAAGGPFGPPASGRTTGTAGTSLPAQWRHQPVEIVEDRPPIPTSRSRLDLTCRSIDRELDQLAKIIDRDYDGDDLADRRLLEWISGWQDRLTAIADKVSPEG
jgi:hypothetical protein